MTATQQVRLACAIKDAIAAQGVQQKDVAMKGAMTSQGTLSAALACKANMSETKWRGACEYLGLVYDEIISDLDHPAEARETEPERENEAEKKDNEEIRGGYYAA